MADKTEALLAEATEVLKSAKTGGVLSLCLSPKDTYMEMVAKGEKNVKSHWTKVFHAGLYGGLYVGYGGFLSLVVCGGIDSDWAASNSGPMGFIFGILFPVNLLLLLLTGGQLFTGNSATMPCAWCEGKATVADVLKCWGISWFSNQLGALIFAGLVTYCGLNSGGTAKIAIKTLKKKLSATWGQTFVKGILCNWMVCMAVWFSCQAQDLTGKMVGIYLPISSFVAMGFEHSPANMFMLPLGLMAQQKEFDDDAYVSDYNAWDIYWKNLIPTGLGNAFAGTVIVAMGYSLIYGQFYDLYMPHPQPAPASKETDARPEAQSVELQSIAVDSEATLMG